MSRVDRNRALPHVDAFRYLHALGILVAIIGASAHTWPWIVVGLLGTFLGTFGWWARAYNQGYKDGHEGRVLIERMREPTP